VDRFVGRREQQRAQAQHAQQRARLVGDVQIVDELGLGPDLADLGDRRVDGAVRIDPDVVGRHQAAGGILGERRKLAQLLGGLRLHLGQQRGLFLLREFAEQVGGVVGVHLFDDVGGALGAEVVDQRALGLRVEVFERVGRVLVVERADDAGGILRGELADDLGQVGRLQPGQAVLAHREADLVGIEVVQRGDVVPGD